MRRKKEGERRRKRSEGKKLGREKNEKASCPAYQDQDRT
jgi:hypothetical protein